MGILLWPDGLTHTPERLLPARTVEDLQLERLCGAMRLNSFDQLSVNELLQLWTEDEAVLAYRQEVLRDLLDNPALAVALEGLLDSLDLWESRAVPTRRGDEAVEPGLNLGNFSFLDAFLDRITSLAETFSALPLRSRGMQALSAQLNEMRGGERFAAIRTGFSSLCGAYSLPDHMTLGFNLDRNLRPTQYKLLKIEGKTASYKRMAATRNAYQNMNQLAGRAVNDASNVITLYVKRASLELRQVRQDVIFYLSARKLIGTWTARGLPYCFPDIVPAAEKVFEAEGLYNPLLVESGEKAIVSNAVRFAPGGELLVLTGANQGGKTVFLLSVGLAQWLFQLGFAVPAAEARLSPADTIATVFAPSGSTFSRHGLLAEEAGRIAAAVQEIRGGSLALFNEPLNSTSPNENLHISREVLGVVKAAGVRGIWVTHLYELASDRERLNVLLPWGSRLGSLRIVVAHSGGEAHSTYRVERGEPEFHSYAAEVLRRKGIAL